MQSDVCSWSDWRSGLHQQFPPLSEMTRKHRGVSGASMVSHGNQLFVSGAAECSGSGINQVLLKRQKCRCDSEASNVLQIYRSQARWRSKYNSFPCQQLFHTSFVPPSLLRRARLTSDKLPQVLAFRHEVGPCMEMFWHAEDYFCP